ncbi:endonuclease/exonuclease/phosphatase family protein [Myxococcus sp. 1LA]
MASNLSSGNYQSYDPGHGIRLIKGVDPDIVLMQEFNYGNDSAADIRSLVDQIAPGFHYSRETGAQIPNGVISRWPIIQSGQWPDPRVSNRDFAWARIDIPGPRDLWAVSVHLLTSSASNRNAEAQAIVTQVRSQIPEDDYLIIGGDLNTDNFNESCFATFRQVVTTAARTRRTTTATRAPTATATSPTTRSWWTRTCATTSSPSSSAPTPSPTGWCSTAASTGRCRRLPRCSPATAAPPTCSTWAW